MSSKGITELCTHLHPPTPSSLQHPQQYLNQNIAHNWAISQNLGRKTRCCPFWLKIGRHDIVEVLIPNPELDFWNLTPKSIFGQIWPKNWKLFILSENWCTEYLKDADSESRHRFLEFRPQNPILGKFVSKKSKLSIWSENWSTWYLKDADSYCNISFLIFKF